jgi:uncharacterized protein (TIGR00369 family)
MSEARIPRRALQALLDRSPFLAGYGFRLKAVSARSCTLALPWRAERARPGGTLNGPAFVALADCAMWLAIKHRIGPEQDAVTAELHTAFLAAARRETVYCTARILKFGKRLIHGIADCRGRHGRILAHHSLLYARI